MAAGSHGIPAPVSAGVPTGRALSTSHARTSSGDASGAACSISAASPATTAAACDVPVPRKRSSSTKPSGWSRSALLPGARRLITCAPGAARSGRRSPSPMVPKSTGAGVSSVVSTAATAIADSLDAGADRPTPPVLPVAVTTTIPADHARSTAASSRVSSSSLASAASKARSKTPTPCSSAWSTTQWMPSTRADGITVPSRPATLTATMPASGAIPRKPVEGSCPATMPARCVPCPCVSTPAVSVSTASPVRSVHATTRSRSASTDATPVSTTATFTPSPVMPCSQTSVTPSSAAMASVDPRWSTLAAATAPRSVGPSSSSVRASAPPAMSANVPSISAPERAGGRYDGVSDCERSPVRRRRRRAGAVDSIREDVDLVMRDPSSGETPRTSRHRPRMSTT